MSEFTAKKAPMSVTFLIGLVSFVTISAVQVEGQDQANGADMLGLSVAQIAELRHYIGEEHYVTTTDGYILQVTRILNPLITDYSKKLPLLLLHGLFEHGSAFVTNSVDARPRDYSQMNAGNMSRSELEGLLANDSSAKCIAFLASNFGIEVWILNRRGTSGSRGHVNTNYSATASYNSTQVDVILTALDDLVGAAGSNLSSALSQVAGAIPGVQTVLDEKALANYTFDPSYWDFSLDEEAKYDIPEVTDYILGVTNQTQLNAIGHSASGAMILMGMATIPEMNSKIANPILWAPALYIDLDKSNPLAYTILLATSPVDQYLSAPFLPVPIFELVSGIGALASSSEIVDRTLVATVLSLFFGDGSDQQNIIPGMFNNFPAPDSAHLANQFYQVETVGKGRMHTFDFGSASANQAAYGSPTPILYDVSKITNTNMSFWFGNKDALVAPENRLRLYRDLTVPYNANLINGTGIFFNHQQFFNHVNVSILLNIPTLQRID